MAKLFKSEYTRMPIYDGDINNIIGIFHIRKANHLARAEQVTHGAIKRFAEEPYFIPASTTLTTQLLNFKTTRNRFAVVVDEYGEVQGLVHFGGYSRGDSGRLSPPIPRTRPIEEVMARKDDGSYLIDGVSYDS